MRAIRYTSISLLPHHKHYCGEVTLASHHCGATCLMPLLSTRVYHDGEWLVSRRKSAAKKATNRSADRPLTRKTAATRTTTTMTIGSIWRRLLNRHSRYPASTKMQELLDGCRCSVLLATQLSLLLSR